MRFDTSQTQSMDIKYLLEKSPHARINVQKVLKIGYESHTCNKDIVFDYVRLYYGSIKKHKEYKYPLRGSQLESSLQALSIVYCVPSLSFSLSLSQLSLLLQIYLKFMSSFDILIVSYMWVIAVISIWEIIAKVFLHQ